MMLIGLVCLEALCFYDYCMTLSVNRGKGDYQIDYVPAPRITEADKKNDKK